MGPTGSTPVSGRLLRSTAPYLTRVRRCFTYSGPMSEITVIANLPCLGLERNQRATVELTPMIQGALDGGKLSLVVSDHLTEVLTGENPDTELPTDTISEHLDAMLNSPTDQGPLTEIEVRPRRKPRG